MILDFVLIVVFHVCAIIAYFKVGWWPTILLEIFVVLIIGNAIDTYFERCPVCGKRSLYFDRLHDANLRYTVKSGQCRNCKSYVSIKSDNKVGGDTYYVEDESGQMEKVVPIWRTSKRRKNCEISKDGKA